MAKTAVKEPVSRLLGDEIRDNWGHVYQFSSGNQTVGEGEVRILIQRQSDGWYTLESRNGRERFQADLDGYRERYSTLKRGSKPLPQQTTPLEVRVERWKETTRALAKHYRVADNLRRKALAKRYGVADNRSWNDPEEL